MAKVGQGDPRWLVSNRADGQNVGDWHWKESDLTPWAKETLTSRLKALVLVEDESVRVVVTKASGFDGDVTVSTRKGRKIFFYDLAIDLEWSGEFKVPPAESAFSCTGKIHLSDIEQDSRVEDFQFTLSVAGAESANHRTVKELVRTKGMAAIGDVVAQFSTELRHHAGVASEGTPYHLSCRIGQRRRRRQRQCLDQFDHDHHHHHDDHHRSYSCVFC
jgi:activator of HSP90 ATPase